MESYSGNAGGVNLQAGNVNIDGSATVGIADANVTGILADAFLGSGNSGHIQVAAANQITIFGGGEISSEAHALGNAGYIILQAGSLTIDGSACPTVFTGITADATAGTGHAGDVQINVPGLLSILNSGEISAKSAALGNAGNLDLQVGALYIDGTATASTPQAFSTGILSDVAFGGGNAGSIQVTAADQIAIIGGGVISSSSKSLGSAGEVTLQAAGLIIDGSASPTFFTGIATTSGSGGTGNGQVQITVAGLVSILGSGEITTSSNAVGNAQQRARPGSDSHPATACPGPAFAGRPHKARFYQPAKQSLWRQQPVSGVPGPAQSAERL